MLRLGPDRLALSSGTDARITLKSARFAAALLRFRLLFANIRPRLVHDALHRILKGARRKMSSATPTPTMRPRHPAVSGGR